MAAIVMTVNTAAQMLVTHAAEIRVSNIILHETEAYYQLRATRHCTGF